MNAVPFRIQNVYAGFGECHGLLKQDGKFLVLEFQVQDSVVNLIKSGVKSVEIPLADVARVVLRRRWFGLSNHLEVQLSRMDIAEQVPAMTHGRLALAIYRRDVPAAQELIEGMQQTTGPS
ncbi:MAG: hypothetical protein ACKVP0_26905 [Pirellulaceae bacterium]